EEFSVGFDENGHFSISYVDLRDSCIKQIFLLLLPFLYCGKLAYGIQITRTAHYFLRFDQGVNVQKTKFAVWQVSDDTVFSNFGETANSRDFAQAVQFSKIGLQIQIL